MGGPAAQRPELGAALHLEGGGPTAAAAFLVAGAFRVMNATPSVISRSIMGWLLGWVAVGGLIQAFGEHGAAVAELGGL